MYSRKVIMMKRFLFFMLLFSSLNAFAVQNDKERLNAIIYLINQRISEIKSLSERKAFVIDDIKNDVTKNIAEDYQKSTTNEIKLD